jgi:hypothetical protein
MASVISKAGFSAKAGQLACCMNAYGRGVTLAVPLDHGHNGPLAHRVCQRPVRVIPH